MVDFHVYIPPCSFSGDSLILYDLTYFIGDTQFCGTILLIATKPLLVIAACSQPINHHCNGVYYGHRTFIFPHTLPLALLAAASWAILWFLKQRLLQNKGPSLLFSPNVATKFLKYPRWVTFWHSRLLHFSKLSSSFRHFEQSLHVWSICKSCEQRAKIFLTSRKI